MSNAKISDFLLKKISWYQRIENCLIRREKANKNISIADVGLRLRKRFVTVRCCFIIIATAMPNLSAETLFLAEFLCWFEKVAHPLQ